MTVTQLRRLEFGSLDMEPERLASDWHLFGGHVDVNEAEGTAGLGFSGSNAHQQLIARRQAVAHGAKLSQQPDQTLAAHCSLFGWRPVLFANT